MTDHQYEELFRLLTEIRVRLPIEGPIREHRHGDPDPLAPRNLRRLRDYLRDHPGATRRDVMRYVRPYRNVTNLDAALAILAEEE